MQLTKTQFVRCVFLLLANSKKYTIPQAVRISYRLLDKTRVSLKTKERLLVLLDALESGKITPREFTKRLFLEYPKPSDKVKVLSLKIFE
ncbi:hypothetical protein SIFV0037 [Sulfolobus islandicus filamentous virus]|uniref:Uncharacterized protein 37 n=1 Tax=Sulfolobus islandicus filamentous virus (isolate Iceland/Hveragerdi) TaxID=654908 RepID=Y037_SIFVH|nr:hypothetical protein SIFV0037 [Sulfolobus islandicus filamentous virus]Q914J3.1 RecName: Full=Uncharacterized protein 37; Flags: Precursor [Sulfolobus islandicus filamentous virus (isolate Hveragerdi)]AAL27748.1 hypothetical protein [Sulfolobus islandicus filamentous virus]